MTRDEYVEAAKLADRLVEGLGGDRRAALYKAALRLQALIVPPPTLSDILARVPGQNHTERARAIGLSRQGYYNLLGGVARPNAMTAMRLAELTGVPLETIHEVW